MDDDIRHCGFKKICFVIPGKPVPQGRPRFSSINHRAIDPQVSREYKKMVSDIATQAALEQEWEVAPESMPCRIEMKIYKPIVKSLSKWRRMAQSRGYIPPISKTGDIENIEKGIMDACTGIIYHDDCQVFGTKCEMRYSEVPRVEVVVIAYFLDFGEIRDTCLKDFYSAPRPYRIKEQTPTIPKRRGRPPKKTITEALNEKHKCE